MSDIVSVKDVSFSYKDWNAKSQQALGPAVFSHLDLTVREGERVLILAPPDSGKTTLARMLAGLVPKYMDGALSGSLVVDGNDLAQTEPWDLIRSCGYVSQNPLDELVAPTCEDEIAFPLESLGYPRFEIIRHVRRAIEAWGLGPMQKASAQELSGGERKRLLLAVQEAVSPKLWILDESFDDLDVHWREQLCNRLSDRSITSIVFGSRYIDQFHGTFDRYAMIQDGALVFGPEEDIVFQFEKLCEIPYEGQSEEPIVHVAEPQHVLNCSDIHMSRTRSSVEGEVPFQLSVPQFELRSGMIVSLCGPNGCGKSTFSRLLCGLDASAQGSFSLDGTIATASMLNRSVGYLFQNPDYQIFLPTVREELAWSLKRAGKSSKQVDEIVTRCAKLFRLELEETPATMSFGLRKTLQAAVYYLLDRPFYILDELDSALTYADAFELINLLRSNGAGILMITHDQQFADALSQKSYRITDGVLS